MFDERFECQKRVSFVVAIQQVCLFFVSVNVLVEKTLFLTERLVFGRPSHAHHCGVVAVTVELRQDQSSRVQRATGKSRKKDGAVFVVALEYSSLDTPVSQFSSRVYMLLGVTHDCVCVCV